MSALAQLGLILAVVVLAVAVALLIPAATRDRPYETDEPSADDYDEAARDQQNTEQESRNVIEARGYPSTKVEPSRPGSALFRAYGVLRFATLAHGRTVRNGR